MQFNNPIDKTAHEQRYRVQKLVDMYRKDPMQFSSAQVEELKEMSTTVGVKFQEKEESFNVRRNAKNLMGGFLEGFTTIPTGTKPKTTYEAISHSLGHLAGFAPGILSVPFAALGKGFGKMGLKRASKLFKGGSQVAARMNKYSVPMFFGHKASGLMNKGLQKSGLEAAEFLKKGSAGRAILDEATTLGVASSVSSIWKGPDVMWDSMIHGGIAGGMFGGLGNFTAIGNYLKSKDVQNYRKGEQLLKSAIGAGMLGVPAYLRDEPIEMIIYETLLGGYFGFQGRPAKEKEGGEFIRDLQYDESGSYVFRPESHPEWGRYSKGAQDYVKKQTENYAYDYIVPRMQQSSGMSEAEIQQNFKDRAAVRFNTNKPTREQLNEMVREEAHQYIEFARKGYKMDWEKVSKEYNIEYTREDIDQDIVITEPIKEGQAKTKLDKTREDNKIDKEVYVAELHPAYQNGVLVGWSVNFVKKAGNYGKDTKVGETVYGDTPAEAFEKVQYLNMNDIYIAEGKNLNIQKTLRPMEYKLEKDPITNESRFVPEVNTDHRFSIYDGLRKQGKYIFGGVKDKGNYTLRDYHIDSDVYRKDVLIEGLSRGDKKLRDELLADFNEGLAIEFEWLGIKKSNEPMSSIDMTKPRNIMVSKEYLKQWKSNILVEAERMGYYQLGSNNVSKIHNLMKEGHSKNVIDWNKRQQLYQDKSFAIKPDAVNEAGERIFAGLGGKFQYQIFQDLNIFDQYYRKGADGKTELASYESWTDGIVVVRPEIYAKIAESIGLPKSNMFKPVITTRLENGGIMVVKSAGQRASVNADFPLIDMMNNRGLDMVIFKSASKHYGNEKPIDIGFDPRTGKYNPAEFQPLSMPIESVRLNLGTLVDPRRATKSQRVPIQLGSTISEIQSPGMQKLFYEEIIMSGSRGTVEAADAISRYKQTGDISEINKLNIDDIPVSLIHNAFKADSNLKTRTKQDAELAKVLARKIAKMEKSGELENMENFTPEEYKQYVYRNNKFLDVMDFDYTFRHNLKYSKDYWDAIYKKYMIQRYTKPKWQYSGKSWLGGVLPHHQLGGAKVNAGEIKLDNGMGQIKVRVTDNKGTFIKETNLWNAWKEYGNKKEYAHNFELVATRIPMDSMSGARVLKFTGFTGAKGHSARTHAKDDWYLGGADKDSDSIFIFQGFSKKLKEGYKAQENEWGAGTKENPMVEKKSPEMDKLFGIDFTPADWTPESFFTSASQFNPAKRKVVADQAYKGSGVGLGFGLKGKNSVITMLDIINKPMTLTIKKDTGKAEPEYINVTISPKKDGHYNVRRLGMEIVNRSADSANYPVAKDPSKYRDMLLEAGFNTSEKVTFSEVKNALREKNIDLDSMLDHKAKNWTNDGKAYNFEQWQRRISKLYDNSKDYDSITYLTSKQMKKDGLFESVQPYSAKVEEYAAILGSFRDFVNSDPFYRKFADIMPLQFKPEMAIKNFEKNKNLSQFEAAIYNDMYVIASYRALTKKGFDIYKYMRDELQLKAGDKEVLDQIVIQEVLKPLSEKVTILKRQFQNILREEALRSTQVEKFQDQLLGIHQDIATFALKYSKVYQVNPDKIYKLMKDFADTRLMSNITDFKHTSGGQKGPFVLAMYAQSGNKGGQISKDALKTILQSHGDVHKSLTRRIAKGDTSKIDPFSDVVPENYYKATNENKVVNTIVKKIHKIESSMVEPVYKNQSGLTVDSISDLLSITKNDAAAIKLFRDNLKKNKNVADNFNDWFTQFTFINEGVYRDMSTMSIKDIHIFNRWFKDIDRRFIQNGKKLPPYAWRVDPRYMNEQMALFEGKVFDSFMAPVKTNDGVVTRQIKNFTGSVGILREMFRRTNMQIDKFSALDLAETERLYRFRKQLSKEHSHGLNELVIAKRNGEDITQNKWYEKLRNEIFIYDGKTRRMDEMVEIIDNIYTKDFEKFGTNWLWTKDAKGDRIIWRDIDSNKQWQGTINDYFRFNSDGSLDINYFLRKLTSGLEKGLDLPQIGLESLLRFQYEYKLEKIISDRALVGQEATNYRNKFRTGKKTQFRPIGDLGKNYFPRMWENTTRARQAEIDGWMAAKIAEFRNDPKKQAEYEAWMKANEELSRTETGGVERPVIDDMVNNINFKKLSDADIANYLNNIGFFNRPGVSLERIGEKPGWDRDLNTIDIYKDKFIRSYYKNLQSILANNRIDRFVNENKFGKFTNDWADYMRLYVRDSFGHQSTFEQRIIDMIQGKEGAKDTLGLGGTFYYKASDHRIIKAIDWIDKRFSDRGWNTPFFKNIPKITAEKGSKAYDIQVQARREYLSRLIHNMGKMEAKFNLITLLANTGTMTANVFGGSTMTISQGGLKNFARSYNNKWLKENLLTDINGKYVLEYSDPTTGKMKPVTNKKQLRQWAAEQGIIDKFIADEIGVNLALKTGLKGKNAANFVKELGKILRKNPEASNETILELARRYGVQDSIEKGGAWFMQKSERIARTDAFLTHAIQFKERYGSMGHELKLNDPAVIDAGLKGVEATQFLYHSAFRPAYMRTSLGKVLTRFKLFAFQSVRTRKELYRQAKHYGFEEGTPAFERFKDLFLIDMFTMALGTAFTYSLFDTALPPPYDWIQETGEWLFGDTRERDKAFFGQWPYPVAPLQVATPPVARIPMAAFTSLINNDWERFADYHIHTMYPFGRIVRQVDQTIDEPYGTTFGRGMQQFFRLPTDKLVSKLNKAQIDRDRKDLIDSEIKQLGEII